MISKIDPADMLTAAPLLELRAVLAAELDEIISLSPSSDSRLQHARMLRRVEAAIERGATEHPICGSKGAAEIMGVCERQATKLAQRGEAKGGVKGWQRVLNGPWVFDVRSCRAYAGRKQRGTSK